MGIPTDTNEILLAGILGKLNLTDGELRDMCNLLLCQGSESTITTLCRRFYSEFVHKIETLINNDRALTPTVPEASKIILVVLFTVVLALAAGGNVLVIATFIFNNNMRSVTNVFILSLAVTDLIVAFTCIPINIGDVLHSSWIFGKFGCKLLPFIMQFAVSCSALTLCCIAFDRYYAIVHPLKLKFLQTLTRATILQAIVCLIALASSIPQVFFFDVEDIAACTVNDEEPNFQCMSINFETRRLVDIWLSWFATFLGPFLFMSIIYAIVCYKLWIQGPVGAISKNSHDSRLKLKRRAIKMLLTVVFIFATCWSPLVLFYVISGTESSANAMYPTQVAFLQCLAMSSTCWNPLVYAFMNEKFRKAFRSLMTCKKTQVHPLPVRNNEMRMSEESRKMTSNLQTPTQPTGSGLTSETKL